MNEERFCENNLERLSDEDKKILKIFHDANLRAALLARLRELGEIHAFLEIENETN